MRLFDERRARALAVLTATCGLAVLTGCSAAAGGLASPQASTAGVAANGPQADYPVLVGDPYTISGKTFTPVDSLNYDEVGYLAAATGGRGITAAHHTLPVPSYVEVTSLVTGRTILVRVEQRGPMYSTHLLSLSETAMEQLGASEDTPVRVRRVNPPEEQRAMLRAGGPAPLRMDTPMSLVSVLKRQLPLAPVGAVPAAEPVMQATEPVPQPAEPADSSAVAPPEASSATPAPSAAPAESPPAASVAQAATGGFVVQAAAFSSEANAQKAADALGGTVSQAGRFYRVRTGPFASRAEAEASLAKVRAAGYSDARILTNG